MNGTEEALAEQPDAQPSRRSAFAFLVAQNISGYWISFAVTMLLIGVLSNYLMVFALLALLFVTPSLLVLLWGVSLTSTSLVHGFRWKQRQIPLPEITGLTVGHAEGFGLYQSAAMAMRVETVNGRNVLLRESQWCSRQRLLEWAEAIAERNEHIDVAEGSISWNSYQNQSKTVMDLRRPPRPPDNYG